ncbi:hypothetical protein FRC03_000708 [Tulasnella sp. 419]|nr:hypothetical protein FRC03_000708 [Tulasnella sp. 419]
MDGIGLTIDLLGQIKSRFDQAGENTHNCALLSSDVINSLLKIREFTQHQTFLPPQELRDNLSEFETDLNAINSSLNRLINPATGSIIAASKTKLKEIWNVDDIMNELDTLRQKVDTCHQQLQTWSTVRTETRVANMHEDLIARLKEQESSIFQLHQQLNMLIPLLNSERNATLEQITEQLPEQISEMDTNVVFQQELVRIQSRNSILTPPSFEAAPSSEVPPPSESAPSIKTARFSITSFSSSIIDKRYIRDKVKEIGRTLPQVRDQVFRQSTIRWINHFRGLDDISAESMDRQHAVRETLRILTLLRSGKRIPYITAAKDLFCLAKAVRVLGMSDQASVLYHWGVQICCELGTRGSPRTLLYLVQFLHKLTFDQNIGLSVDAQRTFAQAAKIRGQLEEMGETAYLAILASSLETKLQEMGAYFWGVGGRCLVAQEAVAIYRHLASVDRATYAGILDRCLRDLVNILDESGRYREAVKVGEEAVSLGRELVAKARKKYLRSLSDSLHSLASNLDKMGSSRDAVQVGEQAVMMWRELVEKDRNTHLSGLSHSLHQLAVYMDRTGRLEEALALEEEAVEMRREADRIDPILTLYQDYLCQYLHSLATYLDKAGRTYKAVKAEEEVVDMYRRVTNPLPFGDHLHNLSKAVHNLATYLDKTGRCEEAVKLEEEAVDIYRQLVGRKDRLVDGRIHLPALGQSLHNLADYLDRTERSNEAAKVGEKAVRIRQGLVEKHRSAHLPDLSLSVHQLALYMDRTGRSEEALSLGKGAADMCRELVEQDRNTHLPNFSQSVHNVATYLDKTGRSEEAVQVGEQAVKMRRELVKRDRHTYLPDLSLSLHQLALYLRRAGRPIEAVKVAEEAVALYRSLAAQDPKTHHPNLVISLQNLVDYMRKSDEQEDATKREEEISSTSKNIARTLIH